MKNLSVDLLPLNSSETGLKMVVIKLTETKALIIESRRFTEFSCRKDSSDNGLLAYIYDGTLGHAEEFFQPLIPKSRSMKSVNCAVSPYVNPIFTTGEEVEFEGIKIKVKSSSNSDRIEISRS